jgi:hypothetical protein
MTLRSFRRARHSTPAGFVRPGLVLFGLLFAGHASADSKTHKGEVCLGVHFGGGNYDNDDFNADLVRFGYDPINSGIEYGFSVDYRLSRWLSVNGMATRIGGQSVPAASEAPGTSPTFTITGSPLTLGIVGHPWGSKHVNLDVFAGGGPLLNATIAQSTSQYEIEADKVGFYYHGGVTGEYRFSQMVAISLSFLVRRAEASNVDLTHITGDPSAHWDVTFNGTAFWFGPRIYFGTTDD